MPSHWEGAATPNVEGYAMHGEGSKTKRGRAFSSIRRHIGARPYLGKVFVVARGVRARSRESTRVRCRCEKSVRVCVSGRRYMGGEARQ